MGRRWVFLTAPVLLHRQTMAEMLRRTGFAPPLPPPPDARAWQARRSPTSAASTARTAPGLSARSRASAVLGRRRSSSQESNEGEPVVPLTMSGGGLGSPSSSSAAAWRLPPRDTALDGWPVTVVRRVERRRCAAASEPRLHPRPRPHKPTGGPAFDEIRAAGITMSTSGTASAVGRYLTTRPPNLLPCSARRGRSAPRYAGALAGHAGAGARLLRGIHLQRFGRVYDRLRPGAPDPRQPVEPPARIPSAGATDLILRLLKSRRTRRTWTRRSYHRRGGRHVPGKLAADARGRLPHRRRPRPALGALRTTHPASTSRPGEGALRADGRPRSR